jgi:predicted nucleic acid-binding protein
MAMGNKIFLDTSYLIALSNRKDSLYRRAKKISKTAQMENSNLYISQYIFLEFSTILRMKIGVKPANEFCLKIFSNIPTLSISDAIFKASWNLLKTVNNKNISFVDCSCAEIMKNYGIKKIATFDKHFGELQRDYNFKIIS